MNHHISNELFNVTITSIGAEISSFKSKPSGTEYIWQADPKIWGSHAPVLFPIVGGLRDNKFQYHNRFYSLKRHGFIRGNEKLKVTNQSNSKITLQLQVDDEIRKRYPFEFIFSIHYWLDKNKLHVTYIVQNIDYQDLYFSLGGHPAFNCPIHPQESYEDYYLKFEKIETLKTWNLNKDGLMEQEGNTVLDNTRMLPLHQHLFDNDAFIFKTLKSREVSLCSRKSAQKIIVRFSDYTSLGIWAKPAAPFICIEPWLGYADASTSNYRIQEKEAIITLKPHHSFKASYSIEIQE